MSVRSTARALPTLLRVGFAEAVAYRAQLLVWILTGTMPFIMLALWSAVARGGAVGRFDASQFSAYFLVTFAVRQLTGSWVAWEINWEIRQGTLSMRLLRPLHPLAAYAAEALSMLPLRVLAAAPVIVLSLLVSGAQTLPGDGAGWALSLAALAGAWAIGFLSNFCIGCLAFHLESSLRVMDVWLVLYWVASGYLIPVELFPPAAAAVLDWLPFRYMLGLPVELLTGAHDPARGAALVGIQWLFVLLFAAFAAALWRSGLRRFGAYGG